VGRRLQQRHRFEHRPRTGDEPVHARSPLRGRLALACFGLADGLAGVAVFGFWLRTLPFLVLSAILSAGALANIVVVLSRMRQGPHFQPGPDVPPYRPVDTGHERRPVPRRERVSPHRRRVRYVAMLGSCLVLIVLAWFWVRFYSVAAAGAMTVIAALLPPTAAIMANADSPILREDGEQDGEQRDEERRDPPDPPGQGRSRD